MRVIFMGTDKFAIPALKAVIDSEVELVCVITQPDRPSGRKLRLAHSPVKEFALENDLQLCQPKRVREKEFIEKTLKVMEPDIIVVVAFGQILPIEILDLPKIGCINLHPSLLPKLRGAAPVQRAIINGETQTGLTVIFLGEGEDTGDIIIQEKVNIDISDTAEILFQKLADVGTRLLRETLRLAQLGPLPRLPQDHTKASYAPKLKKEEGLIDWNRPAIEIHNLIRGTIPWPGAYTTFGNGIQLKIWAAKLTTEPTHQDARPGTIIGIIPNEGIGIATDEAGTIIINIVQPANKSKMTTKDFINGYRIGIGDVFL